MFCPSCGSNEQSSQYCRACGTDLRVVRVTLERPDSITASAVSAREDIGRAVAARIREVEDAHELKKVAEDVLPQIEKFLESPEEKRLRRMRAGVVTASVGVGAALLFLLLTTASPPNDVFAKLIGGVGLSLVTFFIGVGLLINALLFTRPRSNVADHSSDAATQKQLDAGYAPPAFKAQTTSNLAQPSGSSITEHTTHHLKTER